MARLAESDYRKALEVLYAAGENDGPLPFAEPVLDALRDLVPCDVVAYHERSGTQDRAILHVGEPVGDLTEEIRAAHRRLAHEDPLRPVVGAHTLTDLIPLREFRRRDFYRYVHQPLGIEYMLSLFLDPHVTDARFDFDRRESDFTERDRKVLNLLLPHLRQFLHAGRRRLRARSRSHGKRSARTSRTRTRSSACTRAQQPLRRPSGAPRGTAREAAALKRSPEPAENCPAGSLRTRRDGPWRAKSSSTATA